jgi:hypothetical protein
MYDPLNTPRIALKMMFSPALRRGLRKPAQTVARGIHATTSVREEEVCMPP